MPNTPHGLPYPASTDPVAQGAAAIQALATELDRRLPAIYANVSALPASPPAGAAALVRVAADELVELFYDSGLGRWASRPIAVVQANGATSNALGTFVAIGLPVYLAWAAAAAAGLTLEASAVVGGNDTSNGQNQASARFAAFHGATPALFNEVDFGRVDFGAVSYNGYGGGVIPWTGVVLPADPFASFIVQVSANGRSMNYVITWRLRWVAAAH